MNKHYIFDSSFLISLYFLEDINHEKALEIFSSLPKDTLFYINEITYIELLTVATYKKGFKGAQDLKSILEELSTFFVNSGNLEYIRYFEYIQKKVSVVDISVLYDAIKYQCEILTFDKQIITLYKSINKNI